MPIHINELKRPEDLFKGFFVKDPKVNRFFIYSIGKTPRISIGPNKGMEGYIVNPKTKELDIPQLTRGDSNKTYILHGTLEEIYQMLKDCYYDFYYPYARRDNI